VLFFTKSGRRLGIRQAQEPSISGTRTAHIASNKRGIVPPQGNRPLVERVLQGQTGERK